MSKETRFPYLMRILEGFDVNDDSLKPGTIVKVTKNGEISYDVDAKEFVVYQECYSQEVGRTTFPAVACAMLNTYAGVYLS